MSVEFLTPEQRSRYGCSVGEPSSLGKILGQKAAHALRFLSGTKLVELYDRSISVVRHR